MLVRIGNAGDVADGQIRVDDIARTNVNVSPRTGPAAGSRPSGAHIRQELSVRMR